MKTTPGLIAIFLISALFLCASIYGWRNEWFRAQLEKNGENIQAIVTESSPSHAGTAHSPAHLAYVFSYSNRSYTGRCFISNSAQRELKPGDAVRVRFLPYRPEVNWPMGVANSSFYKIVHLGLVVVTCASIFGCFLFAAIPLKLYRMKRAAQGHSPTRHQHA